MLRPASNLQTARTYLEAPQATRRARATAMWFPISFAAVLSVLALIAASGLPIKSFLSPSRAHSGATLRQGLASLPLAARGPISSALGASEQGFRVARSATAFRAVNAPQRLQAHFDRAGVLVASGTARVRIGLRGESYGASQITVGEVSPQASANRVTYVHKGIREWYANGPLGLEQGFELQGAPTGDQATPLTLSIGISGNVQASLAAGGESITLRHAGHASLRYGGLLATDATGRALHSWLALGRGGVLLRVDTRGARYPLTIDPMIQQGEGLLATGESGKGFLGASVALSSDGKTALVGAPDESSNVGAAYVFTRTGDIWTQQGEKLTGTGEVGSATFGISVALSANGNTAAIGGSGDAKGVGAVWIFTRSGSTWTQQGEKLTGGEEVEIGRFGFSVSLSGEGNTLLVGGPNDNPIFNEVHGAAWVFTRSGSTWTQQGAKLQGGEGAGESKFGYSVALSAEGTTAVIGGNTDGAPFYKKSGAAWIFKSSGGGSWSQEGPKLTVEDLREVGFQFGFSVAMSANGSTALIGGYKWGPPSSEQGAAWVFVRTESGWGEQAKLTGDSGELTQFGFSVALSADGNTALVGGRHDEKSKGSAWLFVRQGRHWYQQGPKFTGSEDASSQFGTSVALSGDSSTALVGGPYTASSVGEAWAFGVTLSPSEDYGLESEASPNRPRCSVGYPVNCATGNQVETQTDLSVGGRGPGLHLTRTYNSELAATQTEPGPFGYGWTGPYSAHLSVNEAAETATVTQDNGSTVGFNLTPTKTYTPASPLVQATLVKEGTGYIYTLPTQRKLAFNSAGQLTSVTDRNGNAVTMSYNSEKQLETVTDGDGRKLSFTYDGVQVDSVKDPMGHTVKYTYESGNLVSVTQPAEASLRWQFEYNPEHGLTSMTDGRGHAVTTEYYTGNQVKAQTDAMSRTRSWTYGGETESNETTATITEPNTSKTIEAFNSADLPTSITRDAGSPIEATTTYEYDGSDNLLAVTDPNKHTTKYEYDAAGDRTSSKDANGNETKWTYDSKHDIETITTPKGEKTTIKREAHGNPEVIERPAPGSKTQKTTYKYDAKGDLTSETDSLERTRTYEYDAAGDRESETDPAGDKRTRKYNEDSQETSNVSPRGVKGAEPTKYETKIERNAQGRPIKVTDPLGHTTKFTYDGDGNVETMTDGNSHTTTYTYNDDNERTAIKAPNGTVSETGFDGEGRVVSQTDGNKHVTKYVRNLLEEVTEEVNPRGRITKKEYDPAGDLKTIEDPQKRVTTYSYDPGNRLTEIKYSDGKTHSVTYEYDKDDDVVKMVDGTGTTKYVFDQLDRPTETENGHKEVVKYEYDLDSEQTKITYPSAKAITRTFDKDGRLEKVTDWASRVIKFGYDPNSDLTATLFPSETKDEDTYTYNEADQMSEVKMMKSTEVLASLAYTRDNDGQLKKTTSKGLPGAEITEYTYDENNRLTKAGSTAYEYDAANNPTKEGSSTNTYSEADELEKTTGTSFMYDEAGERTKSTPSGAATSYGYNQAGSLISVERGAEGEHPAINDTYAYDGDGLRASQTVSAKTNYFAWDVVESVPLLLSDGTNSYVYGPGGVPVEQISSAGTALYLHHDEQGSTRMLTSATGKSEGAITFDPYGNTTGTTGTATTPLGFDGQYTSADTGLIYLRARVYDPKTAQFLTRDPLNAVTREAYGYAHDNPVTAADPTGLGGSCESLHEELELRLKRLKEQVAEEDANEQFELEQELSPWEDLGLKFVKVVGGCAAGSDVGVAGGVAVGATVAGPVGIGPGAVIGGALGCAGGALAVTFAPVNPLQPSEGSP